MFYKIIAVLLSLFVLLEYGDACSCLNPSENLEAVVCEADAFLKIRVKSDQLPADNPNKIKYKVKVLNAVTGDDHVSVGDMIHLETASNSAACGVVLEKEGVYHVAVYGKTIGLCGTFEGGSIKGLGKIKCKPKPSECTATSEEPIPSCEEGCRECDYTTGTCCDMLKCAVLSCDPETSYLDRSAGCCPGTCVDICEHIICGDNQKCVATACASNEFPCHPVPVCMSDDSPLMCDAMAKECCDGSYVGKNPYNNCEFDPCPPECENLMCSMEAKLCCDGSTVSKNPKNNCEFDPCPPECENLMCTLEAKLCCDGSTVSKNPNNNCEFDPCPPECDVACPEDLRLCCDGSTVTRNPEKDCKFDACPKCEESCPQDDVLFCCDGAIELHRSPRLNCEFPDCPPCDTVDPCLNMECPRGKRCELQPVQCITTPCPSIAQCVNVCRGFKCGKGKVCRPKEVDCATTPCYDVPQCVDETEV